MDNFSGNLAAPGVEYWLRWQVPVCALIIVIPTAVAAGLLRKRSGAGDQLKPVDLWAPCWRNLHPRWLLLYRAFAFVAMAYLLYQTVAAFGFFVFFFYTQWTFALVMIYFAIATVVSIRGCRIHARIGEKDNFLEKDSKEKLEVDLKLQFLDNLLQIVYQTSAGASMLTDIVFWCLLLPFMTGENFQLTLLIAGMHSVNAVFLILESALNRMPFTWFGLVLSTLCFGVAPTLSSSGFFMLVVSHGGHTLFLIFRLHGHLYGIWVWRWYTSPSMECMYCLQKQNMMLSRVHSPIHL